MDSVVLMSAILAAMAAGVLLAYGVCLAMFRIFQIRVEQAQEASERAVVRAAQVAEG